MAIPRLFDTHTHVNFQPFQADYKAVLQRAVNEGIWLNNVGSQWESSQRSVQIAEEFTEGVYASVGVHPIHLFSDIEEQQQFGGKIQTIKARSEQFDYARYKQLVQSSRKVIAIGECGLDYLHFERAQLQHKREQLIQQQVDTLKQHCALAMELDLPIVIHCRDAATHDATTSRAFLDLLDLLRLYRGKLRGVIHCYTGIPAYISKFLELGFYIGFTGIITFPTAKEVQASLQAVPLDRIVLETDAPYLAPIPMRGKRNEPSFVEHVAQVAATLKNVTFDQLAQQTTANAFELFQIK